MHPETLERSQLLLLGLDDLGRHREQALDDLADLSHVEQVVRFARQR